MDRYRKIVSVLACLSVLASFATSSHAAAPLRSAPDKKPIRDNAGRSLYLIELTPNAFDALERLVPGDFSPRRFAARHSFRAAKAIAAFEKRYGFEHVSMTSWVGNSFGAYLSPGQLKQLRDDPLVVAVTEDSELTFSASPAPWYDITVPSSDSPFTETRSWGRNSVNGGSLVTSGTSPRVYVVDAGIGFHADLPTVAAQRLNPNPGISTVGCYAHATHVAGIIGARAGNKGVMGVLAGAHIISVSVLAQNHPTDACANGGISHNALASALDTVKNDLTLHGGGTTGVVNLSINGTGAFGQFETVGAMMRNVATPSGGFGGALVVQSAGNRYVDACPYAYQPASPSDGILVVGAITTDTQIASPFVNQPLAGNEPGSSYGSCVEIYAPGNRILSTWGAPNGANQLDNTLYDNYAFLSGTSMAAPHISGTAAAMLANNRFMAPAQLEAAIQSSSSTTGTRTPDNSLIRFARLPDTANDADLDGIPNHLEAGEVRNPLAKDNDVMGNARLFAMQHYRDFVNSEGEAGGIAFWTGQINSGAQPRAQVIDAMIGTAQVRDVIAPIVRLYSAYFLRIPDYPGQEFWVNYLRAGNSLESVSNNFAVSPEFLNTYGALTNSQFVTQIYRNVLRREPDAGGHAFWTGELNSGARTRGNVMLAFSESAEYRNLTANEVYVTIAYTGLVRRAPDPGGFNFWVGYINGGNSRFDFLNGLLYSSEYAARFL